MHAWVSYTSADTHCCRLRQEPLDLLPGVFQVQTLRHKLQRLERVVFVCSLNLYLHNCPKRAPCSSLCGFAALTLQVGSKWFQTITKVIRRDAFSANISLPSFHKNWSLIGREKLHCWYWMKRAMAMSVKFVHWAPLSPLIASGFGSGLVFCIIIENRFNWREVVPGNVSLPVVERWPLGVRQITRCRRVGQRWVHRFGSDRHLHRGNGRFELTKFESICLRKQQSQPRLLDPLIFHTIPQLCAAMACIQWVAWRTSSVWTCVSLSWCLNAFGRSKSKSSDAMPRAKESTGFDSTFQGKHSFETSSSSYTKKVSVPGRSCGCIELSLMERTSTKPYKPCWNPLSLSMEGGEMIWIERVPRGDVTPYVVWVAYAGRIRIAYAIPVLASAEDMPLDAYREALRGLTPIWILLTTTSTWQGFYIVWWLGFWNVLNCMLVLVFYMSVQAFTLITTNISEWGPTWPAFLGVNAWSDKIEGWILCHFTLAQCRRTNSFAAYALAFTGKSNSKCLNVPYEFLHCRFSSLLNSETVCTLPCKEMKVQFHMLAGHGQWTWRQWFGAWGLSCNLKWIRQRKHNTKCRNSEVHQHIPPLSRIRTKCGKKAFWEASCSPVRLWCWKCLHGQISKYELTCPHFAERQV